MKLTELELELLSDYDKLMMFERGTRGSVSNIPTRHAVANHKYLKGLEEAQPRVYDPSKPSKFIEYLDANHFTWLGDY